MAFIKVFTNGEERTVFLGDESLIFGRDQQTDVMLKDIKASRHHCVIEPAGDGGWQVRDLESANGTKVNGRKIGTHHLEPDDVVEVGDAKILYASEAAAEPARERPARAPRRSGTNATKAGLLLGGIIAVCAIGLFAFVKAKDTGQKTDPQMERTYQTVMATRADEERVRLAEAFLAAYPDSPRAAEVRRAAADARQRLQEGTSGREDGYDPTAELKDLRLVNAVKKLEEMLLEVPADRRPAVRDALSQYRARLREQRDKFFGELEQVFLAHVKEGQFARARQIWFFLRGDEDWVPIPPAYLNRIVTSNEELENAAAASRTKLLEDEARAEAAHDFKRALKLLQEALPRYTGTSVARSIEERIEFVQHALRVGVKGKPTMAPTTVRVDVEKQIEGLLKRLDDRDFIDVAAAMAKIAAAAKKRKDAGFAEIRARARECKAVAALHAALVGDLEAGNLPRTQVLKRWRVESGGKDGLKVKSRGKDLEYTWAEAPAELYLALLERGAAKVPLGYLGLAVAAEAIGTNETVLAALAQGYEDENARKALDAFVAARVRKEPKPDGGYVVHAGELLSKKQYHRKLEEALIAQLQTDLGRVYTALREDKAFSRLNRLKAKKDKLDEKRAFALELIFDTKKYFYPYRGTGRMAEYSKVQQEVDRRVAAVRELWEDERSVSVKKSSDLEKRLKEFDRLAGELEKRLIDVEEKVEEIAYLRSYVGNKFNIRNLFRSPGERDLLTYSDEVMEANTTVEGDITEVEREQVRVTNEYRKMFGRWPVRLVDKLVLSSRGHCEEMSRLGYFGHFSPTPGRRTPYDRMKLQGYDYGSSENCIMGRTGPKAAHDGWCHSSGHHRNILTPMWTEMGTGHYGRYMTQNYGQAPKWSKNAPKEDDPDLEAWEDDDACGDEDSEFDYDDGEDGGK